MTVIRQAIFLVGAERSGTTVLRLMLSHHSQISWCQEFEYVVDQVEDDGKFPELDRYYEWLETNRVFQGRNFAIDRSLDYFQLVNSFLKQQLERDHKKLVGATVHRHFDRLIKIWPDARFIHLIRDGRDVARSCIGMGWSGNVWTGVERWLDAECLWNQLKTQITPDRYIEVTYEDLITNPAQILTHICHFMGLEYDQAMLNYAQDTTYDLPDAKFIQQWRKKMSEHEIQLVESKIAPLLQDRGYELSGLPHLEVTPSMEQKIRFQDWWFRLNFRVQRIGLGLFLADYLSRKLRIKPLEKSTKLKINEISVRYLK
ncbi:sulfotransferase [Crocosphaera sp. UHCC 0190]|uniref:sulfotransferase family protein n=1 Tax=Crocosphaera sp. UHCC 0190 TaxID=3110246 RepID=UPI002B1F0511|nr:sulfotransferase [Crocosphaera sp. UHCC 0190]MEA5509913.1 sulfotransferase [Crocosphaera sp. UHCC 0190]